MSKTSVVFGKSADDVKQWSQDTASSMGLARNEALGIASSFGAMFAPLKIVGQQAADQSERLTQLGADLASFYNTSVQDALDAVKSGLVGESEPLRRYGVLLSETRVQQEALRETGKKHASELTDQEKVLARIALIYKDSKQAQGDFARTSGGFANQTRILNANLKNLGTTLGETIIPALSTAAKFANEFLQTISHPPQENALVPDAEQVALVPKLAHQYEIMRQHGVAAADAIKFLNHELGDSQKGALLVGDAIHYAGDKSDESVTALAKLRGQLQGFKVDADAAAKAAHGVATQIAVQAAAAPRGLAAIGPGARLSLAAARAALTPGTADNLRVLAEQRELNARKIRSLQNRLDRATGKKARDLADQLQTVLQDDASAQTEIASIMQDNAQKAADAAQKQKDAAAKRAAAEKKRRDALREFTKARIKSLNDLKNFVHDQDKARRAIRQQAAAREVRLEQESVFAILGLTKTGDERAPSRGNLLAAIRKAQAGIAGTPQDTTALEKRLTALRQVLNTEFGKLTRDTKLRVAEWLDALAGTDKTGPATATQAASIKQLTRGVGGLTSASLRRLEFNLAGAHLTVPVRGGKPLTVHTTVNLDGKQVAASTTHHQEVDARRRAYQTRGRRALR